MDEIAASVVLGGREKADGADFFCVEVADGQTAQERADGVVELSKKMAGEALGFVFSIATLTSGQMPTGRTASVESVL